MASKPILYNLNISPPTKAVKIICRLIGVDLEIIDVDIFTGENLQPWFLKLNREHTVPTLVDVNGFVLWESHAINTYLIDKYASDDKLYPKDLQTRARVNQRLFFDNSLFVRLRDCGIHVVFNGGSEIPKEKTDPIYIAYDILEKFLETDSFLVGDSLTAADISVACTVTTLDVYAPTTADKHPKTLAWLKRIEKAVPFFDEMNTKHVEDYRQLIKSTLERNKLKK